MRIASLLTLFLASLLLPAQDTTTKVKTVGVTPTSVASGKEMFHAYCASCHGIDGKGNGPAASALKNKPTDLTLLAKTSAGKFPSMRVMNSIKDGTQAGHGSKDMPVWGPILSTVSSDSQAIVNQRIANLVGFIESMQAK
jgi:mono/diheme cytochrome c family protein